MSIVPLALRCKAIMHALAYQNPFPEFRTSLPFTYHSSRTVHKISRPPPPASNFPSPLPLSPNYDFANLSTAGSPVFGLIFSTRQTLFSSAWFLIAFPLSSSLISFACAFTFCASCACVSLNPSCARRFLIASAIFESSFRGATMSSLRSTFVSRWPSVLEDEAACAGRVSGG